jgi:hypothetical protein
MKNPRDLTDLWNRFPVNSLHIASRRPESGVESRHKSWKLLMCARCAGRSPTTFSRYLVRTGRYGVIWRPLLAKKEGTTWKGSMILLGSQGHNLALTTVLVPYPLDSVMQQESRHHINPRGATCDTALQPHLTRCHGHLRKRSRVARCHGTGNGNPVFIMYVAETGM